MNIVNDFYIKCDNCENILIIYADSLEYDTFVYERPMGEEIIHDFHGEICCEECQSTIWFSVQGCEYPVGMYNFSIDECHGGTFLDKPDMEIVYEFDEEYYYDVLDEYDRAESILERNRNYIKSMSPRDFEHFVADIFKDLGFTVNLTKKTRDGGKDIIATKSEPIPYTLFVECKHFREDNKVDVSIVRSVYGVQVANRANQSVIVTSSRFTKDARRFAEEQKTMMELWDIDDLLKFFPKY